MRTLNLHTNLSNLVSELSLASWSLKSNVAGRFNMPCAEKFDAIYGDRYTQEHKNTKERMGS